MTFVRRAIAVTINLGKGTFGDGGFNTVKFSGPLKASANITVIGGAAMAKLDLSLYGLTLSHMNQVASLGPVKNIEGVRNNEVIVEAGDLDSGLGVVYNGTIQEAFLDFSGMPSCSFRVLAFVGTMLAARPVPPSSYRGLTDVATIFKSLAQQGQQSFQNNGVTAQLIDPYLPGTIWEQMQTVAEHANINWLHDETNGTIIIWPKDGTRAGSIPVVSAETGMIGYPSFTSLGIECSCLYNPSIGVGQMVQIKSTLAGATGIFEIKTIRHNLESETPGGQWASHFFATLPGGLALHK